jgi:hypothetical protein
MNSIAPALIQKLQELPPQQIAEVEDFMEFLADRANKRAALDRMLSIVPALEAAGISPLTEEDIAAEVKAARVERRTQTGKE